MKDDYKKKKIKKFKYFIAAGFFLLVAIFLGKFSYTQNNSQRVGYSDNSFATYSGSSDMKDGIALSACGESIYGPSALCMNTSGSFSFANLTHPYYFIGFGDGSWQAIIYLASYATSHSWNSVGSKDVSLATNSVFGTTITNSAVNIVDCSSSPPPPPYTPPGGGSGSGSGSGSCVPDCSGGNCHSYSDGCGGTCPPTWFPVNEDSNYCSGVAYQESKCWTVRYGSKPQNCSGSGNYCAGTLYADPNGCGYCTGTKGPLCTHDKYHCALTSYPSENGCGSCVGTKDCSGWKEVNP